MPQLTPAQALSIGLIVAPLLCLAAAYFTRAPPRRIAGALAGALTYSAGNYLWDALARAAGWWRYPAWGPDGALPPTIYLLAGLVCGGAFGLVGWRVTRRFGRRGFIVFLVAWSLWGALHDLGGSAAFASSNLMTLSPGLAPALADIALYASCMAAAQLAMRLVAGPAAAAPPVRTPGPA